ncbi:hypothetical protein QYF36_010756 [Acer negundo]|nr:hypothetical protein QYF36_010756 [Acer negundo]
MSCSRAEHRIEYLKPSQLFREIMKRDYYHNPAFIGLSFTEDEFPRDETLLENLVDAVQGIRVEEYDLIGLIIADKNSVVNSSFGRAPFGFLFWKKTIYSGRHERSEVLYAEKMLQETIVSNYDNPVLPMILGLSFTDVAAVVGLSFYYLNAHPYRVIRRDKTLLDKLVEVVQSIEKSSSFLDFFRALHIDKDEEIEVKDDKSEDSERCTYINKTSTWLHKANILV